MTHPKRPKEDDVLECFLYPKFCYTLNTDQITDDMLYEEISKFKQDVDPYVKDYLWHRDALIFNMRTKQSLQFNSIIEDSLTTTEDFKLLPHIYINLRFDEDIGDEWFVVFLILNLTKKYEGLIARIVDSDGEFLLAEAAEEIPVWATPETCQNHVFLMNGVVHIAQDKQKIYKYILNSVYQHSHKFKLSDKVQAIILKKISVYPEEIENRKHKARAYLPEKAAYILCKEPKLIAPAIRTICHSDPLERKVCHGMRYFPPEQRVMENVKMTKCLYAMATHCRYTGDLRTGWNLPSANNPKYNAYLLGIKIACGLEMLVARAHKELRECENQLKSDNSPASDNIVWLAFLKRLESSGYFQELLAGSLEREALLKKARSYYKLHVNADEVSRRLDSTETQQILAVYKDIQSNDIEMQSEKVCTLSPEDNDSWLNVDPAQLEVMLNKQFETDGSIPNQPLSLHDKVQAFINQRSGIDGIQFYGSNEKDVNLKTDMEDNDRIDFDPEVFDTALRDILDFVVPGEDDEFIGSSDSELGGDGEDLGGEMDKYMQLLDSQLHNQMLDNSTNNIFNHDVVETNLLGSIKEEAGGSGPLSNILGGPVEKMKHLKLNLTDAEVIEKNN